MAARLTPAQQRMLDEVIRDGRRVYNGRARKTVEILARHGLVTYEYEPVLHAIGAPTDRYTVTPAGPAQDGDRSTPSSGSGSSDHAIELDSEARMWKERADRFEACLRELARRFGELGMDGARSIVMAALVGELEVEP